jgi:hypothetical protein
MEIAHISDRSQGLQTFIRIRSLFRSERVSTNIKFILHKALIRTIMTCAYPAWKFAADNHLPKLQRLQNRVLSSTGNFPRRTSFRDGFQASLHI